MIVSFELNQATFDSYAKWPEGTLDVVVRYGC